MNRKSGVILSYIFMIFEVVSTLLLTPFIIQTLGQAEYGVYKLSASINAYLMLLDLGVGNAIVRYIAKYRADGDRESERKFLGVATIYYIIIATIAIIAGIVLIVVFPRVFAKGLSESEIQLGQRLLGITMLNSAITLGTAAYNNAIIAYEKYSVSKGYSIIQIILRMIFTVIALKAGMGSLGIVAVNLIMTILCRGVFVSYVLGVLKLYPIFYGIEKGFIKDIVAYSSFILLQMVATQINSTADQILLGALVPASATILAIYGVGAQITSYFQSIGTAFTGVLMPGVVRMVENKSEPKTICGEMIRIGRIMFITLGIIWVSFLLYGQDFVVLWAGRANQEAFYVSAILMSAYLFYLVEAVGTQILWAKNEHKEQSILKISIVLINIFLTVLLIRWKPLIGATIGTFISIVLGDVIVMNIVFKKKLGISLKQYYCGLFKGVILCLGIVLLTGLLITHIPCPGWLGFGIKVCISCIVYAISMWLFGLNSYEKNLILSTCKVKKIIKK